MALKSCLLYVAEGCHSKEGFIFSASTFTPVLLSCSAETLGRRRLYVTFRQGAQLESLGFRRVWCGLLAYSVADSEVGAFLLQLPHMLRSFGGCPVSFVPEATEVVCVPFLKASKSPN